ncbi:MAG: MarR family transcriptional regulator [Bacteroidetes bacterium]|nr:MarR family transcriptional regulator [Bacteroidota bacterium]MBU1373083.1 MarR family transcriptional regulator [Bacteroidota bacterium]MBU1484264.1 MarR family transcriptional regulator [Bacteroidota bacterium]MBU1759943.1 MarR family transcriptional regulator [Bacteroidota bacterium]MBU2046437.1 MarR family transcriptional regulator [Bacteroidota bacterium]
MKIEEELKHEFGSPQQRAFTNIIFTSNWVLNKISVALKPTGLSLQQFNALSILDGQPEKAATVNLIKDRLIDRMPNVSRLLNKLMEKGFIQKERYSIDQRVVTIKITLKGIAIKKIGRELIDDVVIDLNDEQSNLLNDLLEKIRR